MFGLLAAATGQLDFFQPWLLASYLVFVIAMATGAITTGPWAERVASAAAASETDRMSPELTVVVHDGRARVGSVVLMSAIVVMIFLIVVKPGR